MLELNKIYNMDCIAGMKKYPNNYFELAIIDPPYGIGIEKMNTSGKVATAKNKYEILSENKNWDIVPSWKYFSELFRVSVNQIIGGGNYFNLPISRGWIVWDKLQRARFSHFELAWTSFDMSAKYIRLAKSQAKKSKQIIHKTQKPVELYQKLLLEYAKKGDKILDTHLGSASSVIACIELGFDYIGFEIDKEYFTNAQKRIDQFKAQTDLFRRAV